MNPKIKTAILTVSATRKMEEDTSGDRIENILKKDENFSVISREVLPDKKVRIKNRLRKLCDEMKCDLVITTGGTGLGPYDLTPEATLDIIDREVPGLPELMRGEGSKYTKRAMLSRGVSGIRNKSLIINLPGSPTGAVQSLKAIIEIIPHSIHILKGGGH